MPSGVPLVKAVTNLDLNHINDYNARLSSYAMTSACILLHYVLFFFPSRSVNVQVFKEVTQKQETVQDFDTALYCHREHRIPLSYI